MAWFSIHGTGINYHDTSYNADVWAYLTGELARRVETRTGRRPIVGAVEGTHGDMTPAVRPGMLVFPEAERVGRGIGAAAAELYDRLDGELTAEVRLGAGLREIDLAQRPIVDGIQLPAPAIGYAKLAGATENTGPVIDRIPAFASGHPKRRPKGPHGPKRIVATAAVFHRVAPPESSRSSCRSRCCGSARPLWWGCRSRCAWRPAGGSRPRCRKR